MRWLADLWFFYTPSLSEETEGERARRKIESLGSSDKDGGATVAAEEGRVGKKNRARRGRETGSGSGKLD